MASTNISFFLTFTFLVLLPFVRANNNCNPEPTSLQCPPPPPCVCICNPTPPSLPPPTSQPPSPAMTNTPPPPPATQPQPPTPLNTPPYIPTTPPPLPSPPSNAQPPPQTMTIPSPPPPTMTSPPPPPSLVGTCSKNATELKICNSVLVTADANLSAGRAEPCCSIIRNLSDVDAVTCLCMSVEARRFSLSPNYNIFLKVCGRRVPQGFSCPGPSPSVPPPPVPPTTVPPPSPLTIVPPPPPSLVGTCSKNATELKICNSVLVIADGNLSAGRAEPCCSIIHNLSDVDAVTCLCMSVEARRFSLSPNFNIFFRVCGRRIPQGFSCPGPSPMIPPPPVPSIAPPVLPSH